ncbi:TetR/AcrR family transcriptional regulator [Arthrobacter zhangbolii]|uniref:TetR/AcrR family transcriptional regulator n=1 Tax=Arthrobacter zhangbolii TaxID=2886936 RepID=A0A9X1M8Q6_9MICC|nr:MULTISPECIES: TetR/AcrR family transcriptional regulator [Arthrobacter]MCC3272915.1 TetR/AcrR family transcriptional regulator [Arthrobacter zhangbolii]MCC3295249.1 TetR/AcrR family transcriptional regulator [Arthrobacter zhangbolii]MDN3905313.1 helix-turn-helix domain-containing protein [Arthrobacter sp. YD2]UON92970.1 TetR/AcrR family transcriptional regulator [Arthrobacter zhangbolii]
MKNSAEMSGGLRERKRTATKLAIIKAARSLTAAHGVNGFTVEELCTEVGISRRTFFNYFPAKEDAILGSPADEIPADLAEAFIAGGPAAGSSTGSLSDSLLADFLDFAVALMDRMTMSRTQMTALQDAVAAEPRLLQKIMHGTRDAEDTFAAILSAREKVPATDPRIRAALGLFSCLTQRAGPAFFAPGNTLSYRSLLTEEAATLQDLLAGMTPVTRDSLPAGTFTPTPPPTPPPPSPKDHP